MITFENISKRYKQQSVLKNVSFTVHKGEVAVLIGPSGCGKTTSLKMINRLIAPTSGKILINGQDINSVDVVQLRRNIGYVIQHVGLFPHFTVRENIEVIPRLEKKDVKQVAQRSLELMEMVGLDPSLYLDRYPTQLSGGQQQRIGVARAFACDPDIILMDEPFSAIDPITRNQLQDELAVIQSNLKKTIVFVTHDIDEAIKVGDRICIMNAGEVVQYGSCEEVLKYPATDFVQEFVGTHRIWTAPELIRAKDIMLGDPPTCRYNTTLLRCMERFKQHKVNHMALVDKGRFVAIISARAVRECDDPNVELVKIARSNCLTVKPDDSIVDILEMVNAGDQTNVPVVDDLGMLRGMITQNSLVSTLSQQFIANGEALQA